METSLPTEPSPHSEPAASFAVGSEVIYGLHGKCTVMAIEERTIAGAIVPFYRLEVLRSPLSRSARQTPAIWVPMQTAAKSGLRVQATREDAEAALAILLNREYYFPIQPEWKLASIQLEKAIELEGVRGLAKAFSYLYVLRKKTMTLASEPQKMFDQLQKALLKEISEALQMAPRDLEDRLSKGMRGKTAIEQ